MTGTGADIVALNAISRERTACPRFYKRIISEAELNLFREQPWPFEIFVWLVWSVKEAVYKAAERCRPHLPFAPHRIVVKQLTPSAQSITLPYGRESYEWQASEDASCSGRATVNSDVFYFKTLVTDAFLFTVAAQDSHFKNVFCGIRYVDNTMYVHQSAEVRKLVTKKLTGLFAGAQNLQFSHAPAGYPVLEAPAAIPPAVVSFSHDRHWVGYSLAVERL